MTATHEEVFDVLLAALGTEDPLESLLVESAKICGGAGLVVNELGEVTRSVGAAPNHLISEWAATTGMTVGERRSTVIGRWRVHAQAVRIRQQDHVIILAVLTESSASGDVKSKEIVDLVSVVTDTIAKLLRAFEGFESFTISTRKEESARLMRDLEVGVTPGREPALWRLLENFGFNSYQPVRIVRARMSLNEGRTGSRHERSPRSHLGEELGLVIDDSEYTSSAVERTALCAADFPIEEYFSGAEVVGAGISEPFTALAQVPEMLRTTDVALAAAPTGALVFVDEMRPVQWAAARMSSRFDRQVVTRYLAELFVNAEVRATISAYIENGANIAQTATSLQVHENTVRYRLGQVERILGGRLGDPRVSADVVIALECARLEE